MKTDLYLILLWAKDDISFYNLPPIWAGFNKHHLGPISSWYDGRLTGII